MATNKECLIIVLDVRSCAEEDFKLKSVKCAAEILKDKIVGDKKDYVSFVLVGCENSDNEPYNYPNIVKYPQTQLCTTQLLLQFYKFVNETPSDEGEWLDGLAVAIDMIEAAQSTFKCARHRILLLFDFNYMTQSYKKYETLTENLLKEDIELIVGTHNIAYVDNAETGEPRPLFKTSRKANTFEMENHEYALKLISNCNATLCNFKEVLNAVFKVRNRRPWVWNAKLRIGGKISISLQGFIAMKDESNIKLKKFWGEDGEIVTREVQQFIKGTEVTLDPDDLIDGYMLGGTPVHYDETLIETPPPHAQGLHFIGFVKRNSITNMHYCGDSLYTLVHQKGNTTSARKLDALVRTLHQNKYVVLCWKVYSVKLNQPKLVVLLPNKLVDEQPASLAMLEMSYHAQHLYWDFPALRTEKTDCTAEQLQAVDKLIDSMDLECTLRDTQQPRQLRQNDLLSFNQLPHIYEQNVMDVIERKVLCQAADDDQFLEMLQDKNFVELFWKLPEAIEEQAKQAAKELKKIFPLEFSQSWLEKLKKREEEELELLRPRIKQEQMIDEASHDTTMLTFDAVSLATPAEDYAQLLEHKVRPLQHKTQRDSQFEKHAAQMRVVLLTLLQRSTLDLPLLTKLLQLYRDSCAEFNAFVQYKEFALLVRSKAIERNQCEFWQSVIVEKKLGPLVLGEPSPVEEQSFYTVEEWQD